MAQSIALAPMQADLSWLPQVAALVRETFHRDVVVTQPLDLPLDAWNPAREQFLARRLLDVLADAKRSHWHRLLGIVDMDLREGHHPRRGSGESISEMSSNGSSASRRDPAWLSRTQHLSRPSFHASAATHRYPDGIGPPSP